MAWGDDDGLGIIILLATSGNEVEYYMYFFSVFGVTVSCICDINLHLLVRAWLFKTNDVVS